MFWMYHDTQIKWANLSVEQHEKSKDTPSLCTYRSQWIFVKIELLIFLRKDQFDAECGREKKKV